MIKQPEYHIKAMEKYLYKKQELDKLLIKLITPVIKNKKYKILDACCGLGHISLLLSKISNESIFLGVDKSLPLINKVNKLTQKKDNIFFELNNINKLPNKYPKKFDITINWKTLSWLPYYEKMMKSLIDVTKKYIFISSLFYEGNIDFIIKTNEFNDTTNNYYSSNYNVYSLPKFTNFVYNLGVKKIEIHDFNIEIDINKSNINHMGTYTLKLENKKRIQISGAVIMNWKIIKITI